MKKYMLAAVAIAALIVCGEFAAAQAQVRVQIGGPVYGGPVYGGPVYGGPVYGGWGGPVYGRPVYYGGSGIGVSVNGIGVSYGSPAMGYGWGGPMYGRPYYGGGGWYGGPAWGGSRGGVGVYIR